MNATLVTEAITRSATADTNPTAPKWTPSRLTRSLTLVALVGTAFLLTASPVAAESASGSYEGDEERAEIEPWTPAGGPHVTIPDISFDPDTRPVLRPGCCELPADGGAPAPEEAPMDDDRDGGIIEMVPDDDLGAREAPAGDGSPVGEAPDGAPAPDDGPAAPAEDAGDDPEPAPAANAAGAPDGPDAAPAADAATATTTNGMHGATPSGNTAPVGLDAEHVDAEQLDAEHEDGETVEPGTEESAAPTSNTGGNPSPAPMLLLGAAVMAGLLGIGWTAGQTRIGAARS